MIAGVLQGMGPAREKIKEKVKAKMMEKVSQEEKEKTPKAKEKEKITARAGTTKERAKGKKATGKVEVVGRVARTPKVRERVIYAEIRTIMRELVQRDGTSGSRCRSGQLDKKENGCRHRRTVGIGASRIPLEH